MKFRIEVDVKDCPYRGKKEHFEGNRMFYKCKHECGIDECSIGWSTFKEYCPLVKHGCLVDES